jgi:hypothetical protein
VLILRLLQSGHAAEAAGDPVPAVDGDAGLDEVGQLLFREVLRAFE